MEALNVEAVTIAATSESASISKSDGALRLTGKQSLRKASCIKPPCLLCLIDIAHDSQIRFL